MESVPDDVLALIFIFTFPLAHKQETSFPLSLVSNTVPIPVETKLLNSEPQVGSKQNCDINYFTTSQTDVVPSSLFLAEAVWCVEGTTMLRCALVCRRWKNMIYTTYGFPIGANAPHLGQISAINDPLICASKGVKSWIFKFYQSFTSTTNEAPKKQHPSALGHDLDIKLKFTCNVHQGKVYALSWGSANTFISASQDGSLCVQKWDGTKAQILDRVNLRSSHVMTCALSPTNTLSASDIVSIYSWNNGRPRRPTLELTGHSGYVSCARFLSEERLISASGDGYCILWDLERGREQTLYSTNDKMISDVMCVSINPANPNIFACCNVSKSVQLFDVRCCAPVERWDDANNDVNSVCFSSNGLVIGSGGDDSLCRVYDLRHHVKANTFGTNANAITACGVSSVAFSVSGRIMFASYYDGAIRAWDLLSGEECWTYDAKIRVSSLAVNKQGTALLDGSWDKCIGIFTHVSK